MELALQVVGLKMTGKIEDAKNVAMRIVGNAGNDNTDSSGNSTGMMQLSSSPLMRDLRPLLFVRGENDNFESRIIDFLVVIDTPMGTSAPHSIPTVAAISHPSPSGQTLLHLAVLLKFTSLTKFLIKRGADLDARDRNGYTALHFAALSQSKECVAILLGAGADPDIVNACGKTPEEIASPGFFKDKNDSLSESDNDTDRSDDEDAELGDAEDDDIHLQQIIKRRHSRRTLRSNVHKGLSRRSADVSRAPTPQPVTDDKPTDIDKKGGDRQDAADEVDAADAKRVVSFMEKMIQRTLAQIPATQGIIPQLPLPHLPNLPDLPAVPWGALPQIPMVFPVFVPMMPNWPAFLGGEHASGDDANKIPGEVDDATPNMGGVALRAAQEWRATWEKWVALAVATTARQQTEDVPPPVYTPRATDAEASEASSSTPEVATHESATPPHPTEIRPVGYNDTPLPDRVIEQFGYQPAAKQTQKLQKKRKSFGLHRGVLYLFLFR